MSIISSGQITITDLSDGSDGRGVSDVAQKWLVQSSSTKPNYVWTDSKWKTTLPAMSATDKYLFVIERTTYTDATTSDVIMLSAIYGDPTGITQSTTEPATRYTGMLWQYTGTANLAVTGITALPNSLYVWTGSAWQLYLVKSTNLQVDNGFISNAMIGDAQIESAKIKSLDAVKVNADKLSAISANLGDVSAGTYTSWSSETVNGTLYLNGIYLYNGRIRSLNIKDPSSIDPDKKEQLSKKKCRGTEVYSGDTHLFDSVIPQLSTASPNDILKGNEFWDKTSTSTYCGKISGYRNGGVPHTKYSSQHHIFDGTLQAKSMSGNVGGVVLSQGSFPVNVTPNNSFKKIWDYEFSSLKLYGQVVGRRQFTLEINTAYTQGVANPDIGYRPYTASTVIGSIGEGVNNREWMVVAGIDVARDNLLFRTYFRDGNGNWSESLNPSSYIYLIVPMIY